MEPREGMRVREKDVTDEPEPMKEGNVGRYPTFQAHIVYAAANHVRALDWKRDCVGNIVGPPTDRKGLQIVIQKLLLASKTSGNGHQLQVSMLTYVYFGMCTNVNGESISFW